MDFLINSKALDEITKVERRRLHYLTLRRASLLREDVLYANSGLNEFQIFFAKHNGRIIGWCAVFPGNRSTDPYLDNGRHYIYTYVQTIYRRKGIGKALVTSASHWAQKNGFVIEVFAWNKASDDFYGACEKEKLPIEVVIEYV